MNQESKSGSAQDKLTPEQALATFASQSADMPERRRALSVLIGDKLLPKQADDALIQAGLRQLILRARSEVDVTDTERLMAIAECLRFSMVVKKQAASVAASLQSAFNAEALPPMSLLADADDRLNMARAIGIAANLPWVADWLARSIAEEETGEKARGELLGHLVARSASLADAMKQLVQAYEPIRPSTDAPGDTMARRLTRTLAAWREVLRDSELPAGDGLGTAMYELLALPLAENGKPQQEKVQLELCEEALLTVHDIVRTRISLAADPDIYKLVAYCRRLFGGSARPWPSDLRRSLQRLVADVSETIVLLGRQGQRDQDLLDQLKVLCDTGDQARAVARQLAQGHAELPETVRDWLNVGHVRVVNEVSAEIKEAAQSNADASIGLALAEARQLKVRRDRLERPLRVTLDLYEPTLLGATEELLTGVQALSVMVEQLAQLREVALLGQPGDEVEVDPKYFDVASGHPKRLMQVKQPAVVKLRSDGTVGEVLVRGLVA